MPENNDEIPVDEGELLRKLCEETLRNPGEFAVLSERMPPQLVHRMHTLLIVTLLNMIALQSGEIQKLQDQIRDDGK